MMPSLNIEESLRNQNIRLTRQFSSVLKPYGALQLDALKSSLAEHGQMTPVIMWGNILLDGYQRIKAMQEIGIERIEFQKMPFRTADEATKYKISNHQKRKK